MTIVGHILEVKLFLSTKKCYKNVDIGLFFLLKLKDQVFPFLEILGLQLVQVYNKNHFSGNVDTRFLATSNQDFILGMNVT